MTGDKRANGNMVIFLGFLDLGQNTNFLYKPRGSWIPDLFSHWAVKSVIVNMKTHFQNTHRRTKVICGVDVDQM